MSAPRVAPLGPDDLDAATALSTAVEWNQTRGDWARLLDLHPDGAFGAFVGGRLAATATIAAYAPSAAWIGMVIVHPSYRGRRLGSAVMDAVLATDAASGADVVGLDATDLGTPLYERRGFVPVAPVDRWTGALRPRDALRADARPGAASTVAPDARTHELDAATADALAAWDRAHAGVDRGPLLRHLLGEAGVRAWRAERDGATVGYGVLRPGRTRAHLGPLVADDAGALGALLRAAVAWTGGAPVFVDAVRHDAARETFEAAGLHVARRLTRMTRFEAVPLLAGEPLRAAVGLEWG